ncbi:hypothetical protein RhiirA5_418846 [Rhizophagus irregularis]|uniref:Uncharacterized protein n=1 Tax=Rhizophagus irregularis TaxID=588596 RepID=A0A2N0PJF4_9GLOM|nr:hypothetical protein RhiirA5_418846 [Rhizophagus irregularis]
MEYLISTCLDCKNVFICLQRKKSTPNLKKIDSNENNLANNELINEYETINLEEIVQTISFNLVIKPFNSAALPSKWMEIEVLSLDDILVDVHHYVKKLIGDDEIIHLDYLITFKPEKIAVFGTQLVDMQDYKKFFSDYKKLSDGKKNMTIMVSLKKKKKIDKQSKRKRGLVLDSEESGIIQQEGYVIRESKEQYRCDQHDTCFIDNKRYTKLTAMHLQC